MFAGTSRPAKGSAGLIAKVEQAFNKRIVLEQKSQMAEALKKSRI
jgi:hypothetical protein